MEGQLLESWKEIAAYLNRSTRTCRRWESELELPVHRLDGTPKARVFAYPEELDRWLREKLHHLEAEEPRSGPLAPLRKRRLFLAAGAAAFAVVLGGAAVLIRPPGFFAPPAVPEDLPLLAILPFETTPGDRGLEDWRIALPSLLLTDLRQSRYLNIVPIRRLYAHLMSMKRAHGAALSPEDVATITKTFEQDFTATGTVGRDGSSLSVEILLRPTGASDAPPVVLKAAARDERSLIARADELSRRIKEAIGLTRRQIAADIDVRLELIATPSPQALKLYARAAWPREWGAYPDMIPALDQAVALDPDFGLAFRLMYDAYEPARPADRARCYEKSLVCSGRLSEREALLLQADFYHFYRYQRGFVLFAETGVPAETIERLKPKTRSEALPVLERLAGLYPGFLGDPIHLSNLVRLYQDAEEWDKAIALLEKVAWQTSKRRPVDAQTLIRCYLARGALDKAEEALVRLEKVPPGRVFNDLRRDIAVRKGQFTVALDATEDQFAGRDKTIPPAYPYHATRGYVLWLADDLLGAEKAYRAAAGNEDPSDRQQRAMDLAVLSLSEGKIGQAVAAARQGLEIAAQSAEPAGTGNGRSFHYLLAYLHRLAGRLPEALKESEEACREYRRPDVAPGLAVMVLEQRARLALESGLAEEFERMVGEIREYCVQERCPKLLRSCHFLRGLQELRRGNGYKAIAELERATGLSAPRTRRSDPAPVLFALAEAYDSVGNPWTASVNFDLISTPGERASITGDVYALSFYRKARIYEEITKQAIFRPDPQTRAKAVEAYKKFLSLWGDADPLFAAQVNDARRRLAALGAN